MRERGIEIGIVTVMILLEYLKKDPKHLQFEVLMIKLKGKIKDAHCSRINAHYSRFPASQEP